jgi:chemotaxis protein methyltransferase CheR
MTADRPHNADPDGVQSLLEMVYQRYGFDFRDYAVPSITRRVWNVVRSEGLQTVAELERRMLDDRSCVERFLTTVTVHVTTMFRDPEFYASLRDKVLPRLRALPFVRIWHAGCCTGEEVYSTAILLHEEGLYDRSRIYATDMNVDVLNRARAGIYPLARAPEYETNYREAGGTSSFSRYYAHRYDHLIFSRRLKTRVVFSQHNLVTDGAFNEFHLIMCRNVMIYFNRGLSERVHQLLYESLSQGGFLGLGSRETIRFTPHATCYEEVDRKRRIYRKVT